MNKTDIEWCYGPNGEQGYTWNPVTGCSPTSPGCYNCYASKIANRFKGTAAFPDGFKVKSHPERLDEPRKLKKPSRIFVCSMSDIFHADVPDEYIEQIFKVMRECPQHTFFVLTKRPERMLGKNWCVCHERAPFDARFVSNWYADNIWVGVSAENQEQANKRIPVLLDLQVAHRFVSVEPMLGPVDLKRWLSCPETLDSCHARGLYPDNCILGEAEKCARNIHLDWVICGAESGPGKRKCKTEWVCKVWHDCKMAKVPFFFKKYNDARDSNAFDGEWPIRRDREYPKSI